MGYFEWSFDGTDSPYRVIEGPRGYDFQSICHFTDLRSRLCRFELSAIGNGWVVLVRALLDVKVPTEIGGPDCTISELKSSNCTIIRKACREI